MNEKAQKLKKWHSNRERVQVRWKSHMDGKWHISFLKHTIIIHFITFTSHWRQLLTMIIFFSSQKSFYDPSSASWCAVSPLALSFTIVYRILLAKVQIHRGRMKNSLSIMLHDATCAFNMQTFTCFLSHIYPYSHYRRHRRRCQRWKPEKERWQLHFHAMMLRVTWKICMILRC